MQETVGHSASRPLIVASPVCFEYLQKFTLSGVSVAVFDDDITYMQPCVILPAVNECCPAVREALEEHFQLSSHE